MEDLQNYILDIISEVSDIKREADIMITVSPTKDGKVVLYYGDKSVIVQVDRQQIH